MSKYQLKFHLKTASSDDLIVGELKLFKDSVEVNAYKATSSFPNIISG